uniref:DUF2134 domain-containing protein n=1 Tax=uncultured bacterium pAG2 TaxID=1781152 RepID=A0A1C9U4J6_9BACT|nr:hypothetical protein [uncultured bacterium pAG2]
MDTTYVSTLLVVFLVLASLAVSIGYLYVDEDDLRSMAEVSSRTGANTIKKRMLEQVSADPGRLESVLNDTVQTAARNVATDHAMGKYKESALMHVLNDNSNRLTTSNDVTVGFWNISTRTYTPGETPVNAMQVRTRRTAESETVGIGNIGKFLGILYGVQQFDYTPDAVAALPARANASFALCTEACGSSCSYPQICSVPERAMVSTPWSSGKTAPTTNRLASTYLMYQLNSAINLSDLICAGTSSQDICRKDILTSLDPQVSALRDMESMMYNPNVDVSNKEFDEISGKLLGWWVIAPVTDCPEARQGTDFTKQAVTRYALVRISRICAPGGSGCQQNNTSFDAPASTCGDNTGLYIDRISCVSCSSKALLTFPGLHPVLVKSPSLQPGESVR